MESEKRHTRLLSGSDDALSQASDVCKSALRAEDDGRGRSSPGGVGYDVVDPLGHRDKSRQGKAFTVPGIKRRSPDDIKFQAELAEKCAAGSREPKVKTEGKLEEVR
jgi:hypothetical protein